MHNAAAQVMWVDAKQLPLVVVHPMFQAPAGSALLKVASM